jgi:tRNA pseudouridine38-40 synthase
MALRRADGFVRYAVSVQYHGASFLGFTYQKKQEDCILPDGTDLRGFRSVEGRLRDAFEVFVGQEKYEHIQVSSRTDRGVHALKNTFHVDILHEDEKDIIGFPEKLHRALGYHLSVQETSRDQERAKASRTRRKQQPSHAFLGDEWSRHSSSQELRILSAAKAPEFMVNHYSEVDRRQPPQVDWNARFSATERTYVYRILHFSGDHEWGAPFEWDRSWRLRGDEPFRVDAVKEAAAYLQGTHDFSSFRASKCQRASPILSMRNIDVHSQPYGESLLWGAAGGLLGIGNADEDSHAQLVTIKFVGNSFAYRQVRNMVGCLAEVGRGRLQPSEVQDILAAKDRVLAPAMAPAHGLFLVDVNHGDFQF